MVTLFATNKKMSGVERERKAEGEEREWWCPGGYKHAQLHKMPLAWTGHYPTPTKYSAAMTLWREQHF
jgi:hypothetical protein